MCSLSEQYWTFASMWSLTFPHAQVQTKRQGSDVKDVTPMPNMTFAVPEELHTIMRKHKEVKWSEVARKALWKHAKMIEEFEQKVREGGEDEETERFALQLGRRMKRGIAQWHGLVSSSTPTEPSPPSSEKGRPGASSPVNGSNS